MCNLLSETLLQSFMTIRHHNILYHPFIIMSSVSTLIILFYSYTVIPVALSECLHVHNATKNTKYTKFLTN